ncbi:uncharacterized protein LOC114767801 isoform X2 [Denticeps clupeoides]|uniref:uncharacterized protein LOC114767801 isoform X2 n=1 Tax=Denticeps clupeoides TaxID=299321 RepID=UPI0010A31CB9|nr:uncharacterized protein LOC114767801 isoform X2 [Denticeps clupeoides]XP_028815391.1 uncharacterized protein LOC114767801 isoform X2 [Denticeps clupeoides]
MYHFLFCILGLYISAVFGSEEKVPDVSQSPRAITLMHLNSSATILCSTTKQQPIGLYLKRRFSGDRDVLYLRVENGKATINREFTNRVLVQGDCCDYQLQLSSLKVEDTDSYYCKWILMDNDKGDVNYFPSHETVIVVRERNPEEGCHQHQLYHIFFILSLIVCTALLFVFIIMLIRRCTMRKQSYRPWRGSHHVCYHQRPQPVHPNN